MRMREFGVPRFACCLAISWAAASVISIVVGLAAGAAAGVCAVAVFSEHGVSIVVDPKSLVYLGGMQLDFVRGMMGHGFKFNNPNAKGSCGCGESVQF